MPLPRWISEIGFAKVTKQSESKGRQLATVSVVVKCYDSIVTFLSDIECTQSCKTEVRLKATGILKAVTDPGFKFTATIVHRILSLLDYVNKLLQAKATDLYTGVKVVHSELRS